MMNREGLGLFMHLEQPSEFVLIVNGQNYALLSSITEEGVVWH